jgi:hypothetical protein
MSTISPDQLPSPVRTFAAPGAASSFAAPAAGSPFGFVPAPATTPRRRTVQLVAALVAGLVLVGGGVAAATRDSSRPSDSTEQRRQPSGDETPAVTDPPVTDPAGNRAGTELGVDDVALAYQGVLGVQASPSSLDCVTAELAIDPAATQHVADWVGGAGLTLADAQVAFTPFVACAPDGDYLASMVPAAVSIVGGSANEACVTGILQSFGVEGRAEAFALAYADPQQFEERMFSTFAQCVV